jgi:hypothetical protein
MSPRVVRHIAVAVAVATGGASAALSENSEKTRPMKIRISVEGGPAITGTLEDSRAARDFASLLPLRLPLTDYAATEKISDLPRRLVTEDAPAGIDPKVGDITYYAPWGNLALFYKDFRYSEGLVRLGGIESGIEALRRRGPLKVNIEIVDE